MDFIILNSDGSLQKQSLTRYIQQGSHGVDEIFIGWVNATSSQTLQAVFTLPNQLTNTELGVFEEDYEYEPGETISGWVITLTENQTRYNGALMVSARIILNGIVQVAYPFALIINETGVRPETDSGITLAQLDSYLLNIQTLITGAVQQNTDAALSSTSENPVQNKVITNAIETLKRGSYTKVDTTEYPTLQDFLDTEGEEGYLYLYPVNTSDEDEGYYQYIWENDLWIPLGTTKIDIANMVTTDTPQDITAAKTFTNGIKFPAANTNSYYEIICSNGYYLEVKFGGTTNFNVQYDGILNTKNITPLGNNTYNLGSSSSVWSYIYVNNLSNGSGDITSHCNFKPSANNSLDLGSSSYCWKDLYLRGQIQSTGSLGLFGYVGTNTTGFTLGNGIIQANRNLAATTNETRDLGSSSIRWLTTYTKNISDGTNNIAVANIGKKIYKHTIQTGGGGGADIFILSHRSTAYTLPIDWLSLNTDAIKVLYNGCLVLRIYESSGNYYAQYINDSNTITNSSLGASTIEDTVTEL